MLVALTAMPSTSSETDLEGSGYEPLSPREAEDWLRSITLEELIDLTIHYDYIEHADPAVSFPDIVALRDGEDLVIDPQGSVEVDIGRLGWRIESPTRRIEGFAAGEEWSLDWRSAGYGFAAGVLAGATGVVTLLIALR